MQEFWKDVIGYEGLYCVSNLGRVKSLKFGKERFLKTYSDGVGYLTVSLCKNGMTKQKNVHQLVAIAFLEHTPNGRESIIDHIDNNKLNNQANNLQVVSVWKNRVKDIDKTKTTSKYTGVHWCKRCEKWIAQIRVNKKKVRLGSFNCEYSAHLAYQKELEQTKK